MGLSIDKPFIFSYIKLRNIRERIRDLEKDFE